MALSVTGQEPPPRLVTTSQEPDAGTVAPVGLRPLWGNVCRREGGKKASRPVQQEGLEVAFRSEHTACSLALPGGLAPCDQPNPDRVQLETQSVGRGLQTVTEKHTRLRLHTVAACALWGGFREHNRCKAFKSPTAAGTAPNPKRLPVVPQPLQPLC